MRISRSLRTVEAGTGQTINLPWLSETNIANFVRTGSHSDLFRDMKHSGVSDELLYALVQILKVSQFPAVAVSNVGISERKSQLPNAVRFLGIKAKIQDVEFRDNLHSRVSFHPIFNEDELP